MKRVRKLNDSFTFDSTESLDTNANSSYFLMDEEAESYTSVTPSEREGKRKRAVRYRDYVSEEDLSADEIRQMRKTIEIHPRDVKKVRERLLGRFSTQPHIIQNFTTDFEELERLWRSTEASAAASAAATPESGVHKPPVDFSKVADRIEDLVRERTERERDIEAFLQEQEKLLEEEEIRNMLAEEERRKMRAVEEKRKKHAADERRKMLAEEEKRKKIAEKEKIKAEEDRRRMIEEQKAKNKQKEEEKRKMNGEFGKQLSTGCTAGGKFNALVNHAHKRFSVLSAMLGGIVLLPNIQISQSEDIIIMGYSRCPFGHCGRLLRIPLRISTEPDLLKSLQQKIMPEQSNNMPNLNSGHISTCGKSTETDMLKSTDKMTEIGHPEIKNKKYLPKLVLDWELAEGCLPCGVENATFVENLGKDIAKLLDDLDEEKITEKCRAECAEDIQ